MTQEVLKLALEALESCDAAHITDGGRQWYDERLVDKAITAVKEALAQPQQEPVATLWQHGRTGRTRITMPGDITDCDANWFPAADLYAAPPQRTWVGLTDAERLFLHGHDSELDENEWIAGTRQWCAETSAELRRLHEVNQMLLEATKELMDTKSYWWQEVNEETIERLNTAIEKAGEA